MLLTNKEMLLIRHSVEEQAGFDGELISRCGPLFSIEAFDNAVQQAFTVLEERLRRILNKERGTGKQLIDFGFSQNGPFAKLLSESPAERDGLQGLLSGAFSLYRNTAAHTIAGYSCAEARAIINLVDLLLKRLDRLALIPFPDQLPPAAEQALAVIEKAQSAQVANRTRILIGRCFTQGIEISPKAKLWVPFVKQALAQYEKWPNPKLHKVTLFYIYTNAKDQGLWFPVNQYHKYVVGSSADQVKPRLKELDFQQTGTWKDYTVSFSKQNSQAFFDAVYELVLQITKAWDLTMK
jgi:uncharacterized protein (TIGR02391 family)